MKTGKKRFIGVFAAIFLLVFAAACVFGACGSKEKEATVESVSVSPTSLELTLDSSGEASGTVTATVKMSDSSNYTGDITVGAVSGVTYSMSMSNSSATIIVTATEPVSATSVSVSAGGKSASFTLTVNAYEAGTPEPEPEPGTEENYAVSVAAESSVTEVEVGSTLQLTASVTNNGTAVEGAVVTWSQSSEDGGEVEFSETTSGLITGKSAGTVTITATYTPEGGAAVSGSITITVKAKTEEPEPTPEPTDNYAVSVTAADGATEVEVEGSLQLTATVTNNGTEVSGATVEWTQSSTDGGAVEFDSTTSGLITGKTAGTVTITATYTPNGGTAVSGSITINVKAETKEPQPETPTVSGITLSGDALVDGAVTMTLADGTASATITATVVMSEGSYEGEAPQATCEETNLIVTVGTQNADGTYTITITASGEVTSAQVKVSLGSVETTFTVTVNAEPAAPHEHTFVDAQPVVDWTSFDAASDKTAVQVTYTCTDNECDQSEGYTVTITATVTSVDTAATCTENAYTTYTATWASDDGLPAGTDTHVVTYENTAGHVYSDGSEVTWTWTLDTQNGGYMVTAVVKCDNCDETVNATVTVTYDGNNIRYTATATIEGRNDLSFTDVLQEEMTLAGENVTFGGVEYKANPGLSVTVSENSEGEKVYSVSGAAYGLEEAQLVNFPEAALGDAYVAVRFYVGYGETLNYGWDGETFTKTTGQNPYENDPWGTIIIHVANGGAVKFQLVKADGTSEIFWISFENLTYSDITMEASSSSVSVEVGKTKTLSVTVKKNGVDITDSVTLDWSFASDIENLITLEGGVITAGNGEGTATVTVTYKYGEGDEDCVCVAIIVNVVSGDQKEAEERLTAVKESIDFNGATFTNQSDVSFVYDYKSETPDETYGYYYIYMRAEGTASSMNAAQVEAFDPDVSLHTPYVVLTVTLNPGETVSYKSGRSVTNDTDEVEYDVIVVSITNYAYYQFKITSEDDSVGTMYVVDFSYMNKAAGHAFPETSEGLTWNWEGRDTTEKTVDVSFVCDDHVVSVTAQYTIDANGVMTATAVFDEEHSYEGTWNLSSVGTAEGLVNAFAESETEVNITLTADVADEEGSTAVFDAFYYTFYYSTDTRTVTVDLNAHTLDLSSDIYTFIIIGNDVTFKNGELVLPDVSKWAEYGNSYSTMGMLEVQSGSLTLDGITIKNACGTVVFVDGEGTKATIKNSTIETTGAYGVGTNASEPYDCEIVVESSYIIANAEACDGTGVFMNVPGKLTITESYIEGDVQAVVARGGDVTITGSTLALSGKYTTGTMSADNAYSDDYGTETAWGGGNNLPYAALVLGNNYEGDSYQYATTATLNGITFDISSASDAWAIYAYSYNSTCTVSVTIGSGWTYTSGLDYLGITYLDDGAILPVYCGISGDGSITVGGEILAEYIEEAVTHEHDYKVSSSTWTSDYTSCEIVLTCTGGAGDCDERTVTLEASSINFSTVTESTCTSAGSGYYVATVEFDGETYSVNSDEIEISALGHIYPNPVADDADIYIIWNWDSINTGTCEVTVTIKCANCGEELGTFSTIYFEDENVPGYYFAVVSEGDMGFTYTGYFGIAEVSFIIPMSSDGENADTTTYAASGTIDNNSLFTLTAGEIGFGYKFKTGATFEDMNGNTVNPDQVLITTSSVSKGSTKNIVSITAKANVTVYLYMALSDSSYGSTRTGTLSYSIDDGDAVQWGEEISTKDVVTISMNLSKGQKLSISASVASGAANASYVCFFGAEAKLLEDTTGEPTEPGEATVVGVVLNEIKVTLYYEEEIVVTAIVVMSDGSTYAGTNYTWSVSEEGIVYLSGTGDSVSIRGLTEGMVTLTIKVGEFEASCDFTIKDPDAPQNTSFTVSFTFDSSSLLTEYSDEDIDDAYKISFIVNSLDISSKTAKYGDVTYSYGANIQPSSKYITIVIPDTVKNVSITIVAYDSNGGRTLYLGQTLHSTNTEDIIASDTSVKNDHTTLLMEDVEVDPGTYYIYSGEKSIYVCAVIISYEI